MASLVIIDVFFFYYYKNSVSDQLKIHAALRIGTYITVTRCRTQCKGYTQRRGTVVHYTVRIIIIFYYIINIILLYFIIKSLRHILFVPKQILFAWYFITLNFSKM